MHLVSELKSKFKADIVAKRMVGLNSAFYSELNAENLSQLRPKLMILSREIQPTEYVNMCMAMCLEEVEAAKKGRLDFLATTLVSCLVNLGMTIAHIRQVLLNEFFGKKTVKDTESLKVFFKRIKPTLHEFHIVSKLSNVSSLYETEATTAFGVELSETWPEELKLTGKQRDFIALEDGQTYAIADAIKAYDCFAAVELARSRLTRLNDFAKVFHHKETATAENEILSVQTCCDKQRKIVSRSVSRMHFVSDNRPEKAKAKLEFLLKNLNLVRGKDKNKFFRVVDFHGLSVASDVLENQLLNLWISLETIVPTSESKTNIDTVVTGVLPFTGIRYFSRILDYLSFDLARWDRLKFSRVLNGLSCPKGMEQRDRLFFLLALEENKAALDSLLSDLGSFELLRYRLFTLSKLLGSPKAMREKMETHQQKIEWQIRRIYRTRNLIVHSGITPQYAGMLVENAHDYFDQVFERTCQLCSGKAGFHNFDEAFDFTRWKFEEYSRCLKSTESFSAKSVEALLSFSSKP